MFYLAYQIVHSEGIVILETQNQYDITLTELKNDPSIHFLEVEELPPVEESNGVSGFCSTLKVDLHTKQVYRNTMYFNAKQPLDAETTKDMLEKTQEELSQTRSENFLLSQQIAEIQNTLSENSTNTTTTP